MKVQRWLAVLGALATGCAGGRAAPPHEPGEKAPAAASSPPSQPTPAPAPDHSLAPEQYFAMGMPAANRPWFADDFAKAQQVISKLAAEDPLALPRRSSALSGAVFGRIVSTENAASAADDDLPPQARLQVIVPQVQPLANMMKAYLRAHLAGRGGFGAELVDLGCATFSTSRAVSSLVKRLTPPPGGTPARAQFDKGKEQVEQGLATQAKGLFITLSDRVSLLETDRVRLAACLTRELPKAIPALPRITRDELRRTVREAFAAEPSDAVRGELASLRDELDGAAATGGSVPPATNR
jgi:hypothetical protein